MRSIKIYSKRPQANKQASKHIHACVHTVLPVWGLLSLAPTSLYQMVLFIALLPTSTELAVPSSVGQAGPQLPAVSPQ